MIRYFQKIYHSCRKKEKKSVNVSDTMNRLALDIVKPFLTSAYIYQRPTYHKSDNSLDKAIVQQVLILQSYIYPVKKNIEDLRHQNPAVDLKLHIYLDQTCDSKKELGIQMADMLVGAYRKQEKHGVNDENRSIIPFKVTSMVDTLDFQDQDTFLKLYGLVSLTMKSPTKKDLTAFKKVLKNELDSDSHQHQETNNFNTIRMKLTKAKTKTDEEEVNRKFVKILISLNKFLLKIYGKKVPSAYINNLSRKYNHKSCNRSITNMQRNINKLQKVQLSKLKIFILRLGLKRFNKQLDKLL